VLSLREVAERLGVHEKTVSRLIQEGKIAAYRVGGQIRIAVEDLDRYLSGARVVSQ
jgi:excisionase family DNA binding protein